LQIKESEQIDRASQPRGTPRALLPVSLALIVILGALLASGILPRISRGKELESARETVIHDVSAVRVQKAKRAPSEEELVLPASIEAIQDIPVYARTNGYLKEALVDMGDRVHKGQLLAVIETPEVEHQLEAARASLRQAGSNIKSAEADLAQGRSNLKTAESNVKRAMASLSYSRAQVARYNKLVAEGVVSHEISDSKVRDVDTDEATVAAAESSVEAAKQQVLAYAERVNVAKSALESQASNVHTLETQVGFRKVVAPVDGVVTAHTVDAGALITQGSSTSNTELLRIARTDVLRVYIYVPQAFFESIHNGLDTEITVAEKPGQTFPGKVTRVAGGLDGLSRTLKVEVRIPNPKNVLLPGMYARVRFVMQRSQPPLVIASNCIVVKPEGQFVAVVGADNKVKFHKVNLFRDHGPEVEIVEGLHEGDLVILDPPDNIADGSVVKPELVKVEKAKTESAQGGQKPGASQIK